MFKGFTNELKTIIEESNRNRNVKHFTFCISDLEYSSDNEEGEGKFDIRSPELQRELCQIIVDNGGEMSNPRAIKFVVDHLPYFMSYGNNQPSPSVIPDQMESMGYRNYELWIEVNKRFLALINSGNKSRIIRMPSKMVGDRLWRITNLKSLFRQTPNNSRNAEAEKQEMIKHNQRILKVSEDALEEINKNLTDIDIETAEILWTDILPEDCGCEFASVSGNNLLHQNHIQKCLWREESKINEFKDKIIEAIKQGKTRFEDYKHQVIQEIIQLAQQKGLSENELNDKCPNWKTPLLAHRNKNTVDNYRQKVEKDIENLTTPKHENNTSQTNPKQVSPESETSNDHDNSTSEPSKPPNPPHTDNQTNLQTLKEKNIQTITSALEQEPKLTSSDLSPQYQNWKEQINSLSDENKINSWKDKVLAHLQAQRKEKQTTQAVDDNLKKAQNPNATVQEKKDALANLEKYEGEKAYEVNKEETKKIKKEVARDNPHEYRDKVVSDLNKRLVESGLSINDLDDQTKQEIQSLKDSKDLDSEKLVETEIKLTQKIGRAGSKKKINNLTLEVAEVEKGKNKGQIEKLKQQLLEIIHSSNVYYSSYYKTQAEQLLARLEQLSNKGISSASHSKPLPWLLKIGIGAVIILIIGFSVFLILKVRNKKTIRKKYK